MLKKFGGLLVANEHGPITIEHLPCEPDLKPNTQVRFKRKLNNPLTDWTVGIFLYEWLSCDTPTYTVDCGINGVFNIIPSLGDIIEHDPVK